MCMSAMPIGAQSFGVIPIELKYKTIKDSKRKDTAKFQFKYSFCGTFHSWALFNSIEIKDLNLI